MFNQTDWGQPRPRHQYTYHPRPLPGQKGVLVYSGPLNMTAAVQGYGAYGSAGYGYGYGAVAPHGAAIGGATTVYRRVSVPGAPLALAAYPASTAYVATAAATSTETKGTVAAATTTTTTTTVPAHVAYVHAAATPTRLPEAYHTANYSTRLKAVPAVPTVEDIRLENRRVATERGAYKARPIKPADALPDDMFWCREKDGEWHCRPYYQIENECYPGRWKMDAEHGFLVFHRE
ncbi:uncharacterized protein EI97DRAFT_104924 [Westerdykella ornata]|uniref:Uncharacterized protein n=1 Tax=Westerdykella ornata TaxID=318751 RepID=A0A6A6JUJ6_WESOR|nr:uncharacterized protein EI97DRAFT_104924 [Westerdykella ornata]KAF2279894.1 hypothetical protein EI97DRAFT_104924 [Westerdykella ornata]